MWKAETATEKRAAQREIDQINDRLEPIAKENWELETGMRRMRLRNPGGRKPTWKWDERHGKIVRKGNGGVDWYRYQKVSFFIQMRWARLFQMGWPRLFQMGWARLFQMGWPRLFQIGWARLFQMGWARLF